jgi:hypothetical protein
VVKKRQRLKRPRPTARWKWAAVRSEYSPMSTYHDEARAEAAIRMFHLLEHGGYLDIRRSWNRHTQTFTVDYILRVRR